MASLRDAAVVVLTLLPVISDILRFQKPQRSEVNPLWPEYNGPPL